MKNIDVKWVGTSGPLVRDADTRGRVSLPQIRSLHF